MAYAPRAQAGGGISPCRTLARRSFWRCSTRPGDPLAGRSEVEKRALLKRTKLSRFSDQAVGMQRRSCRYFSRAGRSVISVLARMRCRRRTCEISVIRGFARLGLHFEARPMNEEPYIYHFPDGNASLARLIVRQLVPGVAPGKTMDDVVRAKFDYAKLDRAGNRVRIRLKFHLRECR